MDQRQVIEEVRVRADLVATIGGYVKLIKRGQTYKALCPFHKEKTPSFTVNAAKGLYYCFGCHRGGDVFRFVMEVEGVTFPEALRVTAQKIGYQLPAENPQQRQRQDRLLEASRVAHECFMTQLLRAPAGAQARAYLKERGLSAEFARAQGLGYAPADGGPLLRELEQAGVRPADVQAAGLAKPSQRGDGLYETFRDRVIFPIQDLGGRVVAFGGRALSDRGPKYLNTAETPIYHKGRMLYRLAQAREAIRAEKRAILVEGYTDVLALVQFGLPLAVAPLGTALTLPQAELLRRYTEKVVVNFDTDAAGKAAAERAIQVLLEAGCAVHVLALPGGKDPDEFLRETGVEAYRALLDRAPGFLEYLLEDRFRDARSRGPNGVVEAVNALLPLIARIPDEILRAQYLSRIGEAFQVEDRLLLDRLRRAGEEGATQVAVAAPAPDRPSSVNEEQLIRVLLRDPEAFRLLQARVDLEDFQDLPTEAILRGLFAAAAETGPDLHQVLEGLAEPERRRLTAINVGDTGRGGIQEAVAAYFELRSRRLEQEVRRLRRRMRGVPEEEGDRLLMQIREITRELQDMRAQTIDMSQHFQ